MFDRKELCSVQAYITSLPPHCSTTELLSWQHFIACRPHPQATAKTALRRIVRRFRVIYSRSPPDEIESCSINFGTRCVRFTTALATEKAYRHGVVEFLRFHRDGDEWKHPATLGKLEIEAFLTHLATHRKVLAKTQNQAFSAILFLYKRVLETDLPSIDALCAKQSRRLPVVLSQQEVACLIDRVEGGGGVYRLMVELTYGAGLRLLECCRLRVKDVDFDRRQLTEREGRGDKDRAVPLPDRCVENLRIQMARVRAQHAADVERGLGYADLPYALRRKYPNAERELAWQYVFFSEKLPEVVSPDCNSIGRPLKEVASSAVGSAAS